MKKVISLCITFIVILLNFSQISFAETTMLTAVTTTQATTVTATPTSSNIEVNGVPTAFEAYNINNNNYFKLRDVAYVVNGSEKQFGVTWDNVNKVIDLKTNAAYIAVGGEMAIGKKEIQQGILNQAPIYKDGQLVFLTAYTIGGNNYFKLRDLGEAFGFYVEWNGETQTVEINTSYSYGEIIPEKVNLLTNATTIGPNFKLYPLFEEKITWSQNPITSEELKKIYIYMAVSGNYAYHVPYTNLTQESSDQLVANQQKIVNELVAEFPELFSYFTYFSLETKKLDGKFGIQYNLTSDNWSDEEIENMLQESIKRGDAVLENMVNEGQLTEDMTQEQKAEVIFRWINSYMDYDTDFGIFSYTGYGSLENKTGVCQGYTSLYNQLCKRLGIQIVGVAGTVSGFTGVDSHIWSLAILDGEEAYIDATFGDPITNFGNYLDMSYFMAPESYLRLTHVW